MLDSKTNIEGVGNLTAGRDIKIQYSSGSPAASFKELFDAADNHFKQEINSSGKILRFDKQIDYSSKELFTSLMQIGLPLEASISIPFQIVPLLVDLEDEAIKQKQLTTADIRIAVVNAIGGLVYTGKHSNEEVAMWSTAYIRRYGHPENQFVKVIDNSEEKDLNYEYIKNTIIPHLLERIIGLEKFSDPIGTFPEVFSTQTVDMMSNEIVKLLNSLNVYCIRYKTVIHLLQDIILEPPHPWLVSDSTIQRVCKYNDERAQYHLRTVQNPLSRNNSLLFNQSARECIMHLCALILASYGAFLGVGSKYGLIELRRMLGLRKRNPSLWAYCNFKNIEIDLAKANTSVDSFYNMLDRVMNMLNAPDTENKFVSLLESSVRLEAICHAVYDKSSTHLAAPISGCESSA